MNVRLSSPEMAREPHPKTNFNDLLAEWIDSFALFKDTDYKRADNGTFDWIDWCTHNGEDFDRFVRSRLSPEIKKCPVTGVDCIPAFTIILCKNECPYHTLPTSAREEDE